MQKKLIAVFTIIVMIVCCMASACGGKERAPDPMEGFRTSGRVSGGTLQENVNARTLSVSEAGEDVRI